jgi:aldehyde dehydrogenase (NAD+)
MTQQIQSFLLKLGMNPLMTSGSSGSQWFQDLESPVQSIYSPVDGNCIGSLHLGGKPLYNQLVSVAQEAFLHWRKIPSPARGEIVRKIGLALRENKEDLGALVSYEMGKSLQEGKGEVQEMIDICDFAVGLSRQLYGKTIPSERPNHKMLEQYHPLGIVGIISAFNFPVAVWSWNTALAWVCGNVCLWKPSEKTPFSAIACQLIAARVFSENGMPEGISTLILGDREIGAEMAGDERISLISATGSVAMGRSVAARVAQRLGKSLLELGGNNAIIISPKANLDRVFSGIVFGSIGTAGQRCTSTRRLIVHKEIYETVCIRLKKAYASLKIGNPLHEENHMGPLIDRDAVKSYQKAIAQALKEGGKILVEGHVLKGKGFESGCYVSPCIIEMPEQSSIVQKETFAPILYLLSYEHLDQALQIQNGVKQGLSSALMTDDLLESEFFLSSEGSDCGIANINIGTSGAEIGGAFGGEKETGGGRESGSDAWKVYMRRQTNTLNFGQTLPLAQGIRFNLE